MSWTPVGAPTPGLDPVPPAEGPAAFLATRDHDLARWTALSGRPAATWDLGPQSLDALAQTVIDLRLAEADVTNPRPDTPGFWAMRYLAETVGGGGAVALHAAAARYAVVDE